MAGVITPLAEPSQAEAVRADAVRDDAFQNDAVRDDAFQDDAAISVRGLWKVFGATAAEFQRAGGTLSNSAWVGAVQDAAFDIGRGEVFVIMGLSGSGKSTLLRCMTRLIEPTVGEVLLGGENILAASPAALMAMRRRSIGMVFQHFALLPNRNLRDNIAFPLEIQGVEKATIAARVAELIDLVGLAGFEERFPSALSGGQQQRIGIARSLATDPEFWFLDEPFSALDPLIRADLQDEVMRLQSSLRKTAVFVTHDLDEAIRIADRIAIMQAGRIVQIGTPEQLVTTPATDYVRRFVAKIHPARVVTAARLTTPLGDGPTPERAVGADATVEGFATALVSSDAPLGVEDREGRLLGALDRDRALAVLAGRSF